MFLLITIPVVCCYTDVFYYNTRFVYKVRGLCSSMAQWIRNWRVGLLYSLSFGGNRLYFSEPVSG